MITRLVSRLIPSGLSPAALRKRYGALSGGMGLFLNLILFAGKCLTGYLTGSISIMADAFNNLSDAGSSLVTWIGFRMASHRPDASHPFGHGRIEYLSGLFVSVAILFVGLELISSSAEKLITPLLPEFRIYSVIVLAVSIGAKLFLYLFNRTLGKMASSAALHAVAKDSLGDVAATSAVLASMLIEHWTQVYLDGYLGLLIAIFILYTGFSAAKDTVQPLLGQPPDPSLVKEIQQVVLKQPVIQGIHDLVVHDYGPDRLMVSLHAEVPDHGDILSIHHAIDCAERELKDRFGCTAVIHMDPVVTNDEKTRELQQTIAAMVQLIDPAASIHDFRVTSGGSRTKLIFDVVVPYQLHQDDRQIIASIQGAVAALDPSYEAVVEVDHGAPSGDG